MFEHHHELKKVFRIPAEMDRKATSVAVSSAAAEQSAASIRKSASPSSTSKPSEVLRATLSTLKTDVQRWTASLKLGQLLVSKALLAKRNLPQHRAPLPSLLRRLQIGAFLLSSRGRWSLSTFPSNAFASVKRQN